MGPQIAQPAAYTRTVMVHLNIDRIRRLRRELPAFAPHEHARYAADPFSGDDLGMATDLVEALGSLSPRQRTALALRYVEDLDVATIAERMRCSEGTVKSQLSRGTARLKISRRCPCPGGGGTHRPCRGGIVMTDPSNTQKGNRSWAKDPELEGLFAAWEPINARSTTTPCCPQ